MNHFRSLFRLDFICAFVLFLLCFFSFYHGDIWGVGWDSLNYLFSHPSEFYENTKKIRGGGTTMSGTPYPPSIYIFFALWLAPFKLLGFIHSPLHLAFHYTYWLKTLTTIVYVFSGYLFYNISKYYFPCEKHYKYASIAWLTMPLAFFSQFIFSQYDIFYVSFTLWGILSFLRKNSYKAAFFFGIAITFKYFPAFVFFPILLLIEKHFLKISLHTCVFSLPLLLMNALYSDSPAYIEGVRSHGSIYRVFLSTLEIGGGWKILLLVASFTIFCGVLFFHDTTEKNLPRHISYVWLVSSILPFLYIVWHPQWMMFVAPPIVLTSLLYKNYDRFFLLDLIGMFFFVASVSILFQNNVDTAMFRSDFWGFNPTHRYLMARIFGKFGNESGLIFLSGFWAYLILQIILKLTLFFKDHTKNESFDYSIIKRSFFTGLAIFLIPATYALYKDYRINTKSAQTIQTQNVGHPGVNQ
jgi:hypothetical protein